MTSRLPAPPLVGAANRALAVRKVLWIVLGLNLLVAAVKALIGFWTGSLGVMSDALHSTTDGLSNVVALIGLHFAISPPDREHPYGHAKFETMASVGIACFLLITAFELGQHAVVRLLDPGSHPIDASLGALLLLASTFLVNLGVTWYEAREARRLDSDVLAADASHTRSDLLVTLSLIIGLILADRGLPWLDATLTLAIAGVILLSGLRIIRANMPTLVDEAFLDLDAIRRVALDCPGVLECGTIRTRGRPGMAFAELTIHVPPELTVAEAHRLTDRIESDLVACFGPMEIVIHVEPAKPKGPPPQEGTPVSREPRASAPQDGGMTP
jgi:cation diffusion facilitator family transporter